MATQNEYEEQVSIVVACCVMHNFIEATCGDYLDASDDNVENFDEVNIGSSDSDDDPLETTGDPNVGHSQRLMIYSQK